MLIDSLLAWFAFKRKVNRIPTLSTNELRQMVSNPSAALTMGTILAELKGRSEDIGFALPNVVQLACSSNYAVEVVGVGCLRNHFPEMMTGLELNGIRLTSQSKQQLRNALERLGFAASEE